MQYFLLKKKYKVHGVKRKSSSYNTSRIDHIFLNKNFSLHYGDLTDSLSIQNIISKVKPDEIYNLGAQSHVRVSFDIPEYTGDITGLGTQRLLEAIREVGLEKKTRFYQASSSEMYGMVQVAQQATNLL